MVKKRVRKKKSKKSVYMPEARAALWVGVVFVVMIVLFGAVLVIKGKVSNGVDRESFGFSEGAFEKQWAFILLKDVNTDEIYKIADLNDKPIILESFAVWCPTCTSQQKIIKELHEELGDSFTSISLDTDPNENENIVKKHAEQNKIDWNYTVAPKEMTRLLIDDFGTGFTNVPSIPMVLICPDGKYKLLGTGIKRINELEGYLKTCG